MAAKLVFLLCTQALFIQTAFSQAIPLNSLDYPGFGSILNLGNTLANNNALGGVGSIGYGTNVVSGGFGSGSFGNGALGSGTFASGTLGALSSGVLSSSNSASTVASLTGINVPSGTPLYVTSVSPFGPAGLAVASEIGLEGLLSVNGQLPYLSALAFEGSLPTSGSGVATCGCGNGQVGIVGEGAAGAGVVRY